jgi:hypothetical protein
MEKRGYIDPEWTPSLEDKEPTEKRSNKTTIESLETDTVKTLVDSLYPDIKLDKKKLT